jgi:putative peptidoglycan lipid II flippase
MSTAKKAVKAASVIMIITLLSKVSGFLREITFAAKFGTSVSMDAYNIATVIPMTLFVAVTAAIATTVVPIFTEYFQKDSDYNFNYFRIFICSLSGKVCGASFYRGKI